MIGKERASDEGSSRQKIFPTSRQKSTTTRRHEITHIVVAAGKQRCRGRPPGTYYAAETRTSESVSSGGARKIDRRQAARRVSERMILFLFLPWSSSTAAVWESDIFLCGCSKVTCKMQMPFHQSTPAAPSLSSTLLNCSQSLNADSLISLMVESEVDR